jgi:signal transduction histidine kinase/CheY-like chemotaxis protein
MHVHGALPYQLFVLLVTVGLAFSSAYLTAPYLPAFVSFVCPTFILASIPFFLDGDALHVGIGVTVLGALPLVIRYAKAVCAVFLEALAVRMRNTELVEQLRAQKRAAEEANVAKSRFLAVASHDLRQPLHALGLFVQALQDSVLPAHERQLVNNVRRSLDAMEELFDSLLDISRLDAGAVRARTETFPLATLFERLRFEYAPVAHQKGLSLTVMKTSVYVRSDPTLLARIVRNLVANAVRYTEHGGVVLGCRREGDAVRIEVWDSGPGIPADKRCLVFQEFTQLDNPERDRRKGLGLGLAIVERLARLLGHSVTLRSVVGKGSVFAVTLPRGRKEEHVPAHSGAISSGAFDLTGVLVLVIDDEAAVREGMEVLLRKWGCEVVSAESGAEMRECAGALQRMPDFIISDYRLARAETGAAVVEMLRSEFNADIPALLVTGDTGAERYREGDRGGLPILHKPLNPARLRTLMANLVRKPLPREQPRRFG